MTYLSNTFGLLGWVVAVMVAATPNQPPERVYIYRYPAVQIACHNPIEFKRVCTARAAMERTIYDPRRTAPHR